MKSCKMKHENEVATWNMVETSLCLCRLTNKMHRFQIFSLYFAASKITEKVELNQKRSWKNYNLFFVDVTILVDAAKVIFSKP